MEFVFYDKYDRAFYKRFWNGLGNWDKYEHLAKKLLEWDEYNQKKEGMKMFDIKIPENMNATERYIYFTKLEKEAKKAKEAARKELSVAFGGQNGKFETGYGNVSRTEKTSVKVLDSLQSYLHNIGKLEMCKKDEIDVKKVQEYITLGILPAETNQHIQEVKSETLTVK